MTKKMKSSSSAAMVICNLLQVKDEALVVCEGSTSFVCD